MPIIKHRSIYFEDLYNFVEANRIEGIVQKESGVTEASLDFGKSCLNVSYDLEKINLLTIATIIETNGYHLRNSLGQRFKRALIHFFEENEYENAHTKVSPCCSHSGEILAKAKRIQ